METSKSHRPISLIEVLIVIALIGMATLFIRPHKPKIEPSTIDRTQELARLQEDLEPVYTDTITPIYPDV